VFKAGLACLPLRASPQVWFDGRMTTDVQGDDRPTCGKGIAANAVLPARLAELMAARAEVLERHTQALDLSDPASRQELDAYTSLVRAHRATADDLARLARQMTAYRDLPMGRHDLSVMADPRGQAEAFRRFVEIERELAALLQTKLEEDERLLQ
jgi:hypothetical protein